MTDLKVIPFPKPETPEDLKLSILQLLHDAEGGEMSGFIAAWISPSGEPYTAHYCDGMQMVLLLGALELAKLRLAKECEYE